MSRRMLAVISVVVLLPTVLFAQTRSTASSLEGVWRVQEIVTKGANPATITAPQPGLYIFTGKHYSIVAIGSNGPRATFEGAGEPVKPTDAEMIARYRQWAVFAANAGTYEIKGTTLNTKPLVAKNEAVMQGPGQTREFRLEGNTLWLTQKSADGKNTTQTKLIRVE